MMRSARINFKTTSEVYSRVRRLAFVYGWTVSKAAHEVAKRGLPVLEAEVTEADREAWEQLLEGLGSDERVSAEAN